MRGAAEEAAGKALQLSHSSTKRLVFTFFSKLPICKSWNVPPDSSGTALFSKEKPPRTTLWFGAVLLFV